MEYTISGGAFHVGGDSRGAVGAAIVSSEVLRLRLAGFAIEIYLHYNKDTLRLRSG